MPSEIKKGTYKNGISKEAAYALCKSDLAWIVAAVNKKLNTDLSQQQFDALIDFAYTTGPYGKGINKMINQLNAQQTVSASMFTDYIYSKGTRSNGLLERRLDEVEMFEKGDYHRDYRLKKGKPKK